MATQKPVLHLAKVNVDAIAKLWQKLTGKTMSAEGLKYAQEKLAPKDKPAA